MENDLELATRIWEALFDLYNQAYGTNYKVIVTGKKEEATNE